jgi:hypothetical protein
MSAGQERLRGEDVQRTRMVEGGTMSAALERLKGRCPQQKKS